MPKTIWEDPIGLYLLVVSAVLQLLGLLVAPAGLKEFLLGLGLLGQTAVAVARWVIRKRIAEQSRSGDGCSGRKL